MAPPSNYDVLLLQYQLPGLERLEHDVAMLWLRSRGRDYDEIQFNVRVGEGQAPNPEHLDGIQRMTLLVTQKRIDILARAQDQYTILEVKIRPHMSILGQLLGYRQLWMEENRGFEAPLLSVICRRLDAMTERILTEHGVTVYVYEDLPALAPPA